MSEPSSVPEESEILPAAVRRGDDREVQRLVTSHRDYLKRVVSLRMDRRLQARVDPSDIVQEAQLRAMRRVDEYADNPTIALRVWLRRLACDALVDAQRRHIHADGRSVKRELVLPEQSSIDVAKHLLAGISTPSAQFSEKEMIQVVREAVENLPDAEREIVLLLAFEGLSSSEAAQVLNKNASTVRKCYGRALLRLERSFVKHNL
jgi:RNA polymerase sigma-70 factor (ECF subfamily)